MILETKNKPIDKGINVLVFNYFIFNIRRIFTAFTDSNAFRFNISQCFKIFSVEKRRNPSKVINHHYLRSSKNQMKQNQLQICQLSIEI